MDNFELDKYLNMDTSNVETLNQDNKKVEKKASSVPVVITATPTEEFAQVRDAVNELVSMGKDITDGYVNWLNVGFALADGLGEQGRSFFHTLSSMYHAYDFKECEHQYSECLKGRKQGITINTFWKMAEDAGVDISQIAKKAYREAHTPIPISVAQAEFCATCANVPSGITEQNAYIKEVREQLEENVPWHNGTSGTNDW